MILKIFSGLIIVGCSVLAGLKLSDKKKYRRNIYRDLTDFCLDMINELPYSYITLDKLVCNLTPEIKELTKIDGEFIRGKPIKITDNRLKTDECEEIQMFFNSIGKSDIDGNINLVKHYYKIFRTRYDDCLAVYKKTSVLYMKLGALIGALIFLIII